MEYFSGSPTESFVPYQNARAYVPNMKNCVSPSDTFVVIAFFTPKFFASTKLVSYLVYKKLSLIDIFEKVIFSAFKYTDLLTLENMQQVFTFAELSFGHWMQQLS